METFPEFLRAPGDPRRRCDRAGSGCSWVGAGQWVGTRGASLIHEGRGSLVKIRVAAPGGFLHWCLRGHGAAIEPAPIGATHLCGPRAGLLVRPHSEPGRVLLRRGVSVGPGGHWAVLDGSSLTT